MWEVIFFVDAGNRNYEGTVVMVEAFEKGLFFGLFMVQINKGTSQRATATARAL